MKIAFCFLTRDDLFQPSLWQEFFSAAPSEQYSIFCHPKHPERVTDETLTHRVIQTRLPTRHGHVSIVEATLALYAAAYEDSSNEYFVLLSESTIPVTSFADIRDHLTGCGARSLVPYDVPSPNTEHHARLRMVEGGYLFATAFYHHDQWIILHRRHVGALLKESYIKMFERVFAADEHYIMNVLVHMKGVSIDEVINRRTTFVNWREREIKVYAHPQTGLFIGQTVHPKTYYTLTRADLSAARDAWFFRKVASSCNCDIVLEMMRRR